MTTSHRLEFRDDATQAMVVGCFLLVSGGGTLVFWNVERATELWPLLAIGVVLTGPGVGVLGLRRVVELDANHGVLARQTLFGLWTREYRWPVSSFEAVGSRIAGADSQYLDLVLYRHVGRPLMLRSLLGHESCQREIATVAAHLALPAESVPRARRFIVG